MLESLSEYLQNWNATKTEREKLQGVYLVLGSVIVLLAGLFTFINASFGHNLVVVGLILLGVFVMNGVAWHLLSSIFLSQIKGRPKKK